MTKNNDKDIQVKRNTDIRPECNFCFNNESIILQIQGKGTIVISICKNCLIEINQQVNLYSL